MHAPRSVEVSDARRLIIFVHGFMGSPNQFDYLMNRLTKLGVSSISILLPGHNAKATEFTRNGAPEWEAHLKSELIRLRDGYEDIFIVGHSMGGLLGLNASLDKDNKIKGSFLIATPLKINTFNLRTLFIKLRLIFASKENEIKASYIRSKSITGLTSFFYPAFLKPIFNFYKIVFKTKKNLPNVTIPVCLVHSKSDEVTTFKSAKLLKDRLVNAPTCSIILEKALHGYYPDDEQQIISDGLIEFINKNAEYR